MMSFDTAFERLIGNEGGYVNNPADPGGETNWGITKATALQYGFTAPMRSMTREQARSIYRRIWDERMLGNNLNDTLAFQVFDAGVNHGFGNAIRFLQRAVGVADDGQLGPITLTAIKGKSLAAMLLLFNAERIEFYTKLSTFATFGKGWMNREAKDLRYAAEGV